MVLTLILIVCTTILIITTGSFLRSLSLGRQIADSENSLKAWSIVNACGEYVLNQMVASTSATTTAINWNYGSTTGMLLEGVGGTEETCYIYPVEDTGAAGHKLIKASSTVSGFNRKILIEVATNTPEISVHSWEYVADFD